MVLMQGGDFNKDSDINIMILTNLTDDEIVKYMKECELYNICKDKTYYRRASTIKAWIYWIIDLVTE